MVDSKRSSNKVSDVGDIPLPAGPPQKTVQYTTWPDMIRHWPKTTLCIVSNEFCERFSYYGMRTVLILYLLNVLQFTDNESTIFFNSFTVLCYTTPMLGSIIADGYIGKFWTIFSVSILYAAGQVILAIASINKPGTSVHPWMDLSGLIIIGFGTGGIKPCVSAFGADQFELGQERMLSIYFSMFYFSINAGSMISTFISPIFRSQPCLGQDSCYPMAFGIPAALMIIATGIFMAGSFWYKKPPPKENIFGEVARLMTRSVSNKFKAKESKEHWLDHYLTTHVCENDSKCMELRAETGKKLACHKSGLIDDVKSLLRVLVMFLPVPMFWALYDQQGSIWLIQGIQMDCQVGSVLILPDQMQTLNAILILVFIPLFQVIIYPVASLLINLTPLRKMVAGGLLASLSFVIAGFVQLQVNTTLPQMPGKGLSYITVWNQLQDPNCDITAMYMSSSMHNATSISAQYVGPPNPNDKKNIAQFTVPSLRSNTFQLTVNPNCQYKNMVPSTYSMIPDKDNSLYFIAITSLGTYHGFADPKKPTEGTGEYSMGLTVALSPKYSYNFAMCRMDGKTAKSDPDHPCDPRRPSDFYYWETLYNYNKTEDIKSNPPLKIANGYNANISSATVYKFKAIRPGNWGLYFLHNKPKSYEQQSYNHTAVEVTFTHITFNTTQQGGVYMISLYGDDPNVLVEKNLQSQYDIWQFVGSNSVNILWQVPQIVVITAAEILFSITGYEFAYSQSAPSMKALVQALWLLTTAAGDSIIVLITALDLFQNAATQFFVYAGVMALVIGIFALLSIFYYTYHYYTVENDSATGSICSNDEISSVKNGTKDDWGEEVEELGDMRL